MIEKIKQMFDKRRRKPYVTVLQFPNESLNIYIGNLVTLDVNLPVWCAYYRVSTAATMYVSINDSIELAISGETVSSRATLALGRGPLVAIKPGVNVLRVNNQSSSNSLFIDCYTEDGL